MTKLNEIAIQMQEKMKILKKQMQDEFHKGVKIFFEENPECKAVIWNQYIPYFNDGDVCVFSMSDIHCTATFDPDELEDAYAYEDMPSNDSIKAMKKLISNNKDLMQDFFDDYAAVYITPEKIITEEFEAPY